MDDGTGLFDLTEFLRRSGQPNDLLELAADGWFGAEALADRLPRAGRTDWVAHPAQPDGLPQGALGLPLPAASVGKILALGKNFSAHAAEFQEAVPEAPLFFNKLPETLVPSGTTVRVPQWYAGRVDHEVELGVVIGVEGYAIAEEDAWEHIAFYTLANDLTARSLQGADRKLSYPWFRAKNLDGFCPLGPALVPADFLDPDSVRLTAHVGGEARQEACTSDMVVSIPTALAYLSRHLTLRPGDLILMGTPAGVGPLQDGDVVVCEASGIGRLETPHPARSSSRAPRSNPNLMTSDPFQPEDSFEGRLRGKQVPGGSTPAHLTVSLEGIQATPVEGEPHTLPLKGLRLRRDESAALIATQAGGKWSVSCEDPDFLRSLETVAGNHLNEELARLEGQKVSSRGKHLFGCFLVLAILGLGIWSLPKIFHKSIRASVAALPTSVDVALGEAAQNSMDAGGEIIEDEAVLEPLQAIFDRLTPHAELEGVEYQFRVVRSEIVNAYALPGGFITVFSGLIEESETPEQVAGVIAHEIAHVKLRHGLQRVAHSAGMMAGDQPAVRKPRGPRIDRRRAVLPFDDQQVLAERGK